LRIGAFGDRQVWIDHGFDVEDQIGGHAGILGGRGHSVKSGPDSQ
jgi:hypothetical protein